MHKALFERARKLWKVKTTFNWGPFKYARSAGIPWKEMHQTSALCAMLIKTTSMRLNR
jgi:hypothetical protein